MSCEVLLEGARHGRHGVDVSKEHQRWKTTTPCEEEEEMGEEEEEEGEEEVLGETREQEANNVSQ